MGNPLFLQWCKMIGRPPNVYMAMTSDDERVCAYVIGQLM